MSTDLQGNAEPSRKNNACRPDLHIKLVNLPGIERLDLIVAMIRAIWLALCQIELAMRSSKPSLGERGVGVDGALKFDLFSFGREGLKCHEEICICGR